MGKRKVNQQKSPINQICEGCGEPAQGTDLDGVPLCRSCGVLAEAHDQKEQS